MVDASSADRASDAHGAAGDADAVLCELLAELENDLRAGRRPDVERAARRHPACAAELRSLWGAVLAAEVALSGSTIGARSGDGTRPIPPRSDARPGTFPRRFGGYTLLGEIGRGGMGVVFRARQESLGRTVALKMVLGGEHAAPTDLARFRSEAEAVARLDHPNIVDVYEVGEIEGQAYFTMRLIEGESLAAVIARGPLAPRRAAEILAPVCRAVDWAHGRGVLHRDLKPANILLDAGGVPHITDFGLAKRLEGAETITRTGAIIGTPLYMSPEQAAGESSVHVTSDVYSLGTVLFHALTGQTPFRGDSPLEVLRQVREEEPPLARARLSRVDRDLEMVALRCLQKPPDLRYPTAGALAADLEAYLDGGSLAVRSGSFRQVIGRWFRETHHATVLENWGVLWMWHSVVLLALCGLTWWLQRQGVTSVWAYLGLWGPGVGAWAAIFWAFRRRAGPVTFVERQVAHIWAASVVSCTGLYWIEVVLGLPVLTLSPVLALISGTVFLSKAGVLSGRFYVQAVALYALAPIMAAMGQDGILLFGVVAGACFYLPGWKYRAQQRRSASRADATKETAR